MTSFSLQGGWPALQRWTMHLSVNEKFKSYSPDNECSDIHWDHLENRSFQDSIDKACLCSDNCRKDSCKPGLAVAASGYEVVWQGSNWDKSSGKLTGHLLWPGGRLKSFLQCRLYYSKQNGIDRKDHPGSAGGVLWWAALQCVNSSESELRALISSPPFRQVAKFPGNLTILGSLLPTWEGVFPHVE